MSYSEPSPGHHDTDSFHGPDLSEHAHIPTIEEHPIIDGILDHNMGDEPDGRPPLSQSGGGIGPIERFRLWREAGRLANDYNATVTSGGLKVSHEAGMNPSEAGKYSPIDPDRIRLMRIALKRDINAANRDSGDVDRLIKARDIRGRVEGFAETSHTALPLQQRLAAERINHKHGHGLTGVVPEHLLERSRIARERAEFEMPDPTLPELTKDDLPASLLTDRAKFVLYDIRLRVESVLVQAIDATLSDMGSFIDQDEEYDFIASIQAEMLNKLLSGHFYDSWGVRDLHLGNPNNFHLISRLMQLDDDEFSNLITLPKLFSLNVASEEPAAHVRRLAFEQATGGTSHFTGQQRHRPQRPERERRPTRTGDDLEEEEVEYDIPEDLRALLGERLNEDRLTLLSSEITQLIRDKHGAEKGELMRKMDNGTITEEEMSRLERNSRNEWMLTKEAANDISWPIHRDMIMAYLGLTSEVTQNDPQARAIFSYVSREIRRISLETARAERAASGRQTEPEPSQPTEQRNPLTPEEVADLMARITASSRNRSGTGPGFEFGSPTPVVLDRLSTEEKAARDWVDSRVTGKTGVDLDRELRNIQRSVHPDSMAAGQGNQELSPAVAEEALKYASQARARLKSQEHGEIPFEL